MKTYIILVVIVSVIGSIVSIISPDGEAGGLKTHVRLAVGIAIIPICVYPLFAFVNEMKNFDYHEIMGEVNQESYENLDNIFEESYALAEEGNLKDGIARILNERFEVERSECFVSVKIVKNEGGERRLEQIFINLYGSAIWKNTVEIESYFESIFGCEVVTAVG